MKPQEQPTRNSMYSKGRWDVKAAFPLVGLAMLCCMCSCAKKESPKTFRVGIVSGGGGFCVTATDACASYGLEVPELDADTQNQIRSLFHPYAPPPRNPVDMIARKGPITHAEVVEILAKLDYIDAIIISPPWGGFRRGTPTDVMKELIDLLKLKSL